MNANNYLVEQDKAHKIRSHYFSGLIVGFTAAGALDLSHEYKLRKAKDKIPNEYQNCVETLKTLDSLVLVGPTFPEFTNTLDETRTALTEKITEYTTGSEHSANIQAYQQINSQSGDVFMFCLGIFMSSVITGIVKGKIAKKKLFAENNLQE